MNRFGQKIAQPGEDFRVADRLELLDLVWRFASAMDMGDLEMFEECFAPQLTWDLSRNPVRWTGGPADNQAVLIDRSEFMAVVSGRDAANREVPSNAPRPVKSFYQHGILNPIVTFTGAASATILGYNHERLHHWLNDTPGEEECLWQDQGGWYHLDAMQIEGRWRICALRLEIVFFDPKAMYAMLAPRA